MSATIAQRLVGRLSLLLLVMAWPALAEQPVRIVSLAPNLTELIYAMELEDHLVGRSSACDYPAAAQSLPVAGGFGRPTWEALMALRPDVVVLTDLEKQGIKVQLERQGVRVLTLPCESWDSLKQAAITIAEALDRPAHGVRWVNRLDGRLQALDEQVARAWEGRERPSVYVEIWGNPITTAGNQSFLHEVITRAGGRSLGDALSGRYRSVSGEWVVREQPAIIVIAYMMSDIQAADQLRRRLGWSSIPAVQHDRIIDSIDPDLLLRPGPRLIDGVEQLAEQLRAHSRDLPRPPAY